jgi:hypothetical protein
MVASMQWADRTPQAWSTLQANGCYCDFQASSCLAYDLSTTYDGLPDVPESVVIKMLHIN